MPKPPANCITIYGRKPVIEALQQSDLTIFRVHLADSNKSSAIIRDIEQLFQQRQIEGRYYDRLALSRISKNRKQDQGVAADIVNPNAHQFDEFLSNTSVKTSAVMALENVTNPQNVGMIIRSVTASGLQGLLLPRQGCAKLDSLVVKASAGTLFRGNLLFCETLAEGLRQAKDKGFRIYGMAIHGGSAIASVKLIPPCVIVLGNETEGLTETVRGLCDELVYLPMHNGVESLNVSVMAGIVAFLPGLSRK